ncbi:MAG: hypothetical protein KC483_04320 [Nitrosarchaeum sp.]|nr:hypothetical protein [Nitrosarchaeum sp.]
MVTPTQLDEFKKLIQSRTACHIICDIDREAKLEKFFEHIDSISMEDLDKFIHYIKNTK